jgi:hypothetical protein
VDAAQITKLSIAARMSSLKPVGGAGKLQSDGVGADSSARREVMPDPSLLRSFSPLHALKTLHEKQAEISSSFGQSLDGIAIAM